MPISLEKLREAAKRSKAAATEIKAPGKFSDIQKYKIFLAGAIDQGKAIDWQKKVARSLDEFDIVVLNPRRDDWDDTWEQSIDNPEFVGQVEWELQAQEESDMVIFVFTAESKAPITFLEMGLFGPRKDSLVCAEEGFYRQGNLDVVCRRYKIPIFHNLDELIEALKKVVTQKAQHKAAKLAAQKTAAGQMVYVLTALMDKGDWQPVGVVDDPDVADQYYRAGGNRDWVPLEMNDLSLTDLVKGNVGGNLKPIPRSSPEHPVRRDIQQTTQQVQDTSNRLKEYMDKNKRQFPQPKRTSLKNPLFAAAVLDQVYPDTQEGAIACLRGLSKGIPLDGATARPDPQVQGVWQVTTKRGQKAIVYLAGYQEPFGKIRERNDFEVGD